VNIANTITLIRIALVPVFMVFYSLNLPYFNILAALVFGIASFTDFVDGYLARKLDIISNFGKIMDPLADKILIIGALICMVDQNEVSIISAMIIIARELYVTSLRVVATAEGKVIAAGMWGKVKTVLQIFAVLAGILFKNFYIYNFTVANVVMAVAAFFTLVSGIMYTVENIDVFKAKKT